VIVVSDTSPILNLAAVSKLALLRDLYEEIVLPPAVEQELSRNGIEITATWMRVEKAKDQRAVAALLQHLDPGEAEAIVLAGEIGAGMLLVDEKRGRRIAMERGLEVTGLLGMLAEAKARRLIPECRPILDEMIRISGFWIGDELRTRYLQELNELIQPPE
jgi:predicted nucleic acid-binding protein